MTEHGSDLFFALYRLTPKEADLINEGYVRYREYVHSGETRWSKTPIEGWYVDRDSILPKTHVQYRMGRQGPYSVDAEGNANNGIIY